MTSRTATLRLSRTPYVREFHRIRAISNAMSEYKSVCRNVNPAATYWYLSAAPELLALAGQRLDDHLGQQP